MSDTISYKDFRDGLRKEIWPPVPGEPRNLRAVHNQHFVEAMTMASKCVECLKLNNISVWPFCSTYVECAKSVVAAPVGVIKRVYTIANDVHCDPVRYNSWTRSQLECWAREMVVDFTSPTNTNLPVLQQGYKYAEATTDIATGRARTGAWAIWNHRLYLAPWIQSFEKIVVEWDGAKKVWNDDDLVDREQWDTDVRSFIKEFVRWKHEDQFGCDRKKTASLKFEQAEKLADIIHDCDERTRAQDEEECRISERGATSAELVDDVAPDAAAATADFIVAQIADYGDSGNAPNPAAVAALVAGFSPDVIVTAGDNQYAATPDFAAEVGTLYGTYITSDLTTNRFWPSPGNHDANPSGSSDLTLYKAYFTLPNNERYYDVAFQDGLVHFFMYHSETVEPDGVDANSIQAEWLKAKMLLSTARWKVVVVHNPPYTDHATDGPGHTALRLDYKTWGADLVLSGDTHAYARYEVSDLPYIVNGAGGRTLIGSWLATPNANDAFRKLLYKDAYGALKMTINNGTLKCEFINAAEVVIDTLTLTKS